ncbi:MAG TPA: SIS domain-containing protein [Phycisphaerae bacterium]|nr:SIS domain-containing protein [Phycisphaerae bacterium]
MARTNQAKPRGQAGSASSRRRQAGDSVGRVGDLIRQVARPKGADGAEAAAGALVTRALDSAEEQRLILKGLSDLIRRKEPLLYRPTPDGLKRGQQQKYNTMIDAATSIQAAARCALRVVGPQNFLDDPHWRGLLDRSRMLDRLGRWDKHVQTMWERAEGAAHAFKKLHTRARIQEVRFYGLGGSAAPHDIAREVIENSRRSKTPIRVVRADSPYTDDLGAGALAILASFSGNTEETLECLRLVRRRTRLLAAIARGGELGRIARDARIPFVQLPDDPKHSAYVFQPRESVCLQATASLVFLATVGLSLGSRGRLTVRYLNRERITKKLRVWRSRFGPEVPTRRNPAKRLAWFALHGASRRNDVSEDVAGMRPLIPYLVGDRNLQAVMHEAATQFRERAKVNVIEGVAPEDLHNAVESIRAHVEAVRARKQRVPFTFIFFESADGEPRIELRLRRTRDLILQNKADLAVIRAEGDNPLERALFLTYFMAHVTTYAALLHGADPLPVPTMSWLKNVMAAIPRSAPEERSAASPKSECLTIHGAASPKRGRRG